MINVENLTFSYPGQSERILNDLSFSIEPGEVYGLLGRSGAGKSTTQKILMGLLDGYSGKVEIFGQPLEATGRDLFGRIGVSFELPALFMRLTALENLRFFASLYDQPTRHPTEVLEMVDLQDAAHQRVSTYSKGMKMRLNLCRALLHDPDLLFLDEPTTGQDPTRSRITRNLIKQLKADGKTIFLTTHNMLEADETCDTVGFLSDGRILVSGSPEDLKRQFGERILEVGTSTKSGVKKRSFSMDGIGTNSDFLALLATNQIASMHSLEASLDDVFIKATMPTNEMVP